MKITLLCIAGLALIAGCDSAETTDDYYRGVSVPFGFGDSLLVDDDMRPDAGMRSQYICTRDSPTSACVESLILSFRSDIALMYSMDNGYVLSAGAEVGERPDFPTAESEYWNDGGGLSLAVVHIDLRNDTSWARPRPFNENEGALVGIRVGRADSARFGWIRMASTFTVGNRRAQNFSAELLEVFLKADGTSVAAGIAR